MTRGGRGGGRGVAQCTRLVTTSIPVSFQQFVLSISHEGGLATSCLNIRSTLGNMLTLGGGRKGGGDGEERGREGGGAPIAFSSPSSILLEKYTEKVSNDCFYSDYPKYTSQSKKLLI